jgi:apolipoprotein D and lipocalin family protein
MKRSLTVILITATLILSGCSSTAKLPPIRTADAVDLDRFAGDWYVIANIPTFIETEAYNAIESYAPPVDGKIATTFTFNDGGFDGKLKTYNPTGFVRENTGNAVWGMQFVWPIKAEYRIVYVDEHYQRTIIGRSKRDYVWLMARSPVINDDEFQEMVDIIAAEGYDTAQLRLVPQRQ